MSSRSMERTLAKLQKSVEDGKYYDAHQMYRTVVNRYVAQHKYSDAIELLDSGAMSLLKAKQSGSGADLANYLVQVYETGNISVDASSTSRLGRLAQLISEASTDEPGLHTFTDASISWSTKGEVPSGDPDLHHAFGTIYQKLDLQRAEQHFLLGNAASGPALGRLLYDWSTDDTPPNKALYVLRCVLGYLTLRNIRGATTSLSSFIALVSKNEPSLLSSSTSDTITAFTIPLLNFAQLLVLLVQKADAAQLFLDLRSKYKTAIASLDSSFREGVEDSLDRIAELYFGIRPQRQQQPNILQGLMSSMFAPQSQQATRATPSPAQLPPSSELD